uniref:Uncharacterized protein n=2 Tax=Oryza TaxID=4527 RepID=A0A679B9V1_9ORYZ|nr:hypothetical protein [Oryza barthii]BBF89317.1 hypothetical protein [Oryza barthii]BBF89544.1 hypothetical protein [Oryza glaberrima]
MLLHHSTSADMWDHCTDAPPPASLRAPKTAPHPPAAPLLAAPLMPSRPPPPDAPLAPIRPPSIGRAKPASISAARASHAEPASAAIGCASLRQAGLRPLLQTLPCRPDVAVCQALG